ncbi:hypothetical protein GPB2148_1293 [marine gamma proteobacterium HTCC2148]|nr:hypothetical protein GPB2148_1293 [marine gamma proteobacterium HTCC2148]
MVLIVVLIGVAMWWRDGLLERRIERRIENRTSIVDQIAPRPTDDQAGNPLSAPSNSTPIAQKPESSFEADFRQAFSKFYQPPDGCDVFRSDRHMVECVNHKMRARNEFYEAYGSPPIEAD